MKSYTKINLFLIVGTLLSAPAPSLAESPCSMRGEGVAHCEKRILSDGGYSNYNLNAFKGCAFRRIEEERIIK